MRVLREQVPRVVDERELLLALERARPRVGLVVASTVPRVAQQLRELRVRVRQLDLESLDLGDELGVPLELATLVEQTFIQAREAYGGDAWSPMVVTWAPWCFLMRR